MSLNPKDNVLYQIKDRLLEVMGDHGGVTDSNKIYIEGINSGNLEANRHIIEDEPDAEIEDEIKTDDGECKIIVSVDLEE